MGSPGDISPPSDTTAMTPARKGRFGVASSSRPFNPDLKRSMRMQGVRGGEPNVRRSADVELCVERQRLEIEPRRRDVFAEVAGTNVVAGVSQCIEQFAQHEVDVPQVRRPRVSAREMSAQRFTMTVMC